MCGTNNPIEIQKNEFFIIDKLGGSLDNTNKYKADKKIIKTVETRLPIVPIFLKPSIKK